MEVRAGGAGVKQKCADCESQLVCCQRTRDFRPISSWDREWRGVYDPLGRFGKAPDAPWMMHLGDAGDTLLLGAGLPAPEVRVSTPPGFKVSPKAEALAAALEAANREDLAHAVRNGLVPSLDWEDRAVIMTTAGQVVSD